MNPATIRKTIPLVKSLGKWTTVLKADPLGWLLEADNPSVRYFTLTNLLKKPETDQSIRQAKDAVMKTGAVPKILAKQRSGGYWESPENFYIKTKYKGTVWQFIILAELGADGNDERVKRTCEFILNNSQDRESGGFSYFSASGGGGDHNKVLPCLTGNMVWSLIRLGYLEDPRVQHGINWITKYQRFDDGIDEAAKGWPYDKREKCWGRHTCHMGVAKALKALAETPAEKRTSPVKNTIEKGAEHILKHHIYKRSHDLNRMSKPEWLQFGFPLMWNTDALEILGILTKLGYKDPRMQEAIDLVISKQDCQGRWKLENTFKGRFQVSIEQKGKPSKWITLKALTALERFHSQRSNGKFTRQEADI
jgi:hypothetical protein